MPGCSTAQALPNDLLTTARLLRQSKVDTAQVYVATDLERPAEVVNAVPELRVVDAG